MEINRLGIFKDKFKNAKGHVEINVDGMQPTIKADVNGRAALIIAAHALVLAIAKNGNLTPKDVLILIEIFSEETTSFVGESREQVEVMKEILRQREDI